MASRIVVVGCSWGGLSALGEVLGRLDAGDVPVVIAQHRREGPSELARILALRSGWVVREAEDKVPRVGGVAFLAPAGYHLLVERGHLALSTEGPVRFSRPSVDILFESAAAYGPGVVGVILTGANDDGAAGLAAITAGGGQAVVQDPATAEQPGMPRAALAAGVAATVLPLERIGPFLAALCTGPAGDR